MTRVEAQQALAAGWDLLVVALFSIGIYFAALSQRLPEPKVDQYIRDVYPPPVGE